MINANPSLEHQAPSSSQVPQPESPCRKTSEDAPNDTSSVAVLPIDENPGQKVFAYSDEKIVNPGPGPPRALPSASILQAPPTITHSLSSGRVTLGDVLHTNEPPISSSFPRKAFSEPAISLAENRPNRSRYSLSISSQHPLPGANRGSTSGKSSRTNGGHYQTYILATTAISAPHANPITTDLAPASVTQDQSTFPITIKLKRPRKLSQSTKTTSSLLLNVSASSGSRSQASSIHRPHIEPSDEAFSLPTETTISFRGDPQSSSSSHSATPSSRPKSRSQPQSHLRPQESNIDQHKNDHSSVWVHSITGPDESKHDQDLHQGRPWLKFRGESLRSLGSFLPVVISALFAVGIPAGCMICNTGWLISSEKSPGGKVIFALYCYLIAIMISSMWTVASADAGIIPRNLDPDPEWEKEEISDLTRGNQTWMETRPNSQMRIRLQWVNTGEYLVPSKWCSRCRIYRPPRATHCRICDNCVEQSDHHCTFLNNCIGRKNYFTFLIFLLTTSISMLCTVTISIVHLVFITERRHSPVAVGNYVVTALGLLLGSPVFGLLIFHMKLISSNVTTMERLRPTRVQDEEGGQIKEDVAIYSLGSWYSNGLWIICRPSFGLGRTRPGGKTTADSHTQSFLSD